MLCIRYVGEQLPAPAFDRAFPWEQRGENHELELNRVAVLPANLRSEFQAAATSRDNWGVVSVPGSAD